MTKSIKICHLYPDLLNLYGDLGNIKAMVKHLEASDIKCSVDNIVLGDRLDWKKYDIFFFRYAKFSPLFRVINPRLIYN